MIATDEDAFICDMAETYHILFYKELPVSLVATLACGLGENSRIKMKLSGSKVTSQDVLLVSILDHLRILVWQNTKDAIDGNNAPEMMLNSILGLEQESDEFEVFDSPEDFENFKQKMIGG